MSEEKMIKEIELLAKKGLTTMEIAEELYVDPSVIYRLKKKAGVQTHSNKKFKPEQEEKVVKLYKDGLKMKQLAERMGCSEATIRLTLKRKGIIK